MKYSPKQYVLALYQAVSETNPKDQDRVLDNFASLLRENNDLQLFRQIEEEYRNIQREANGVSLAKVTTASKLSGDAEKKIIKELNDYVKGDVELQTKVDEGLVGGVVVRIKDELIDGSIRKNLENLKEELTK